MPVQHSRTERLESRSLQSRCLLLAEADNLLKEYFGVEAGTMAVNPLYYQEETIMCRVVGGARAVDGKAECLEGQILADVSGL